MRRIAIIPARSGSKGIKNKNIKNLCGKPLMAYTIEAAIKSNIFDCVHVSTDCEEYAIIAREYGADVPFLRDKEFATDSASTWDTVKNVLNKYSELGEKFDVVTILQPTSPLRTSQDICNAYQLFCEKDALSVVSVCEVEHSPLLCNTLETDLSLNQFIDMKKITRRQEMSTFYRINGGIYMLHAKILDDIGKLYGVRSYAYIMEKDNSIDIDDEFDFKIAKCMMMEKKKQNCIEGEI